MLVNNSLRPVALLLSLLLPALAAAAMNVRNIDAFVARDSQLAWVDNDTLIFAGYWGRPSAETVRERLMKAPFTARFIEYRYSTAQWKDRGLISVGGPCFDGGYVRYARPVQELEGAQFDSKWQPYFGKYGYETPEHKRRGAASEIQQPWNCTPAEELPPLPAAAHGKVVKRLRPTHGFVELQQSTTDVLRRFYPVSFFTSAGQRRSGIEALREVDLAWEWPFFEFKNAYWLNESHGHYPRRPPGRHRNWWLWPDGRLSVALEFDLAHTFDGDRNWTPDIPFADGFFATETRGRRHPLAGNIAAAGLYVFSPIGKHQKILSGTVGRWAISRDGCRLAVGVDDRPDDGGVERLMLKVVDACRGDK